MASLLSVIASIAGTYMGITAECNAGNDINQIVLVDVLDFSINPTEQCLNLAAKNYLCYVSWLRMCQLLTVLTGVILKSLKKLPRT